MPNRTYHKRGVLVHGFRVRKHPLYGVWAGMLARCNDKSSPSYPNYGLRGIKVCERWHHFQNFAVDMWPRSEGDFTIERKENNEGYSPENCKWATRSEQCFNRRLFKNSATEVTGVGTLGNGRFYARFDFEHVRYDIGRFATLEEASQARENFVCLFFKDRDAAIKSISAETVWCTSSTDERCVTVSGNGFIVRVTESGVRHYVGYFSSVSEACDARDRYLAR